MAAGVYVTSIRIPSADKGQVSNLAGGCVKILSSETGSAVTPLLSGLIMCHREATHTQGGECVCLRREGAERGNYPCETAMIIHSC